MENKHQRKDKITWKSQLISESINKALDQHDTTNLVYRNVFKDIIIIVNH